MAVLLDPFFFFSLYLEIKKNSTGLTDRHRTIQNCYTKGWHCRLREASVLQFRRSRKQNYCAKTKGSNIARAGTLKHHHCSVRTAISFQTCVLHPPAPVNNNNLHSQLLPEAWQSRSGGRTNRKEFVIRICRGCACDDVTEGKPTHTHTHIRPLPFKETGAGWAESTWSQSHSVRFSDQDVTGWLFTVEFFFCSVVVQGWANSLTGGPKYAKKKQKKQQPCDLMLIENEQI